MTSEKFNQILELRLQKTREVLGSKAAEYARETDRLYNFRRAAQILRITPGRALLGMLAKHWVSVLDLLESDKVPALSLIEEKIGDSINYLILAEAMLIERHDSPNT